jgi:hypothetical protein
MWLILKKEKQASIFLDVFDLYKLVDCDIFIACTAFGISSEHPAGK